MAKESLYESVSKTGKAVLDMIGEVFKYSRQEMDQYDLESNLKNNLGDSLDFIELIVTLEERFNIDIFDEEAEQIQTVGKVVEYIENKVGTDFKNKPAVESF